MNKCFCLFLIFYATFVITKEENSIDTFIGVNLLIQNDWTNDPHVVNSGKDFLAYPIENDPEVIEKLFNESCEYSYDVFCALASEIAKDSPPKYDEWLTEKGNLHARKTYYAKKTIPFITLKIPLELTFCREGKNMMNNMDFSQTQLKNGEWAISEAACYSLEENMFAFGPSHLESFSRGSDTLSSKARWGEGYNIHFFDISNPHGLYCEDRNCPRPSLDPSALGKDFVSFFDIRQSIRNTAERKISDKLIKDMYKTLPEDGEINPEDLKKKYTWELANRLVVIGKSRFDIAPNSDDYEFIQNWAARAVTVERSWAKENFDRLDAYAVVTIPLIQSSIRRPPYPTGKTRSFYGFFKRYELLLDEEIVWCSDKNGEWRINC